MTVDVKEQTLGLTNVTLEANNKEFVKEWLEKNSTLTEDNLVSELKALDVWLKDHLRYELLYVSKGHDESYPLELMIYNRDQEEDTLVFSTSWCQLLNNLKRFMGNKRFTYYVNKENDRYEERVKELSEFINEDEENIETSTLDLINKVISYIRFSDRHKEINGLINHTAFTLDHCYKLGITNLSLNESGEGTFTLSYKQRGEVFFVPLKTEVNEISDIIVEINSFLGNRVLKEQKETNKKTIKEVKEAVVLEPGNITLPVSLLATTKLEDKSEGPSVGILDAFNLTPTVDTEEEVEEQEEVSEDVTEEDAVVEEGVVDKLTKKEELLAEIEEGKVDTSGYSEEVIALAKLFDSYFVKLLPNNLEFVDKLSVKLDKESITNISTLFLSAEELPSLTLEFADNGNIIKVKGVNNDDNPFYSLVDLPRLFSFLILTLGSKDFRDVLVKETGPLLALEVKTNERDQDFYKFMGSSSLALYPYNGFKIRGKELIEVTERLELIELRLNTIGKLDIAAEYDKEGYTVTLRELETGKDKEFVFNPKHIPSGLKGVVDYLDSYNPNKKEVKETKVKQPLELKPEHNDVKTPILDESNRNVPIAREVIPNRNNPNPLPVQRPSTTSDSRVISGSKLTANEITGNSVRQEYFNRIFNVIKERINKWHKNNIEGNPMHISDKLTIKLGDLSTQLMDDLEEELKHLGFRSDFVIIDKGEHTFTRVTIRPAFGFY